MTGSTEQPSWETLEQLLDEGNAAQVEEFLDGLTPAETALAWLLARPGVTAPIVGVTKLEQLDTAVRALDLELTAEEGAALEQPYQPRPIRGWYEGRRL